MQSIADELVERHHHANRIARKPEEVRVANLAVRERTAGLHRDLPEQDFTELVQKLLDEIGFTDRHATRCDDDVGVVRGRRKRALQRFGHVGHDAHVDDIAIEARQHSVERVAIAVVDLSDAEWLPDRFKFVAGRKERDA